MDVNVQSAMRGMMNGFLWKIIIRSVDDHYCTSLTPDLKNAPAGS